MPAFAIHPPVYFRDGNLIASISEAASIVRQYATRHCNLTASALLCRLEFTESEHDALTAALEFRSWAARERLLVTHPDQMTRPKPQKV